MRPVSSATHLADCIDGPARLQRNVVVTYLTGTFHTPPQVRPSLPNGSSSTSCNRATAARHRPLRSSVPPPAPQSRHHCTSRKSCNNRNSRNSRNSSNSRNRSADGLKRRDGSGAVGCGGRVPYMLAGPAPSQAARQQPAQGPARR